MTPSCFPCALIGAGAAALALVALTIVFCGQVQ